MTTITAIPKDPVLAMIYGVPKTGKTTDLLYSLPRAIWIAAPGATAPADSVCGYTLMRKPIDIASLDDAVRILEGLERDKGKTLDVDALILDDLTLYVDRTVKALSDDGVGRKDPRQLWGAVRLKLLAVRDTGRRARVHVIFNAHEAGPKMQNATRIRGGPALPGAGAEIVPAACDMVLRATARAADPTQTFIGWPVVYRCQVQDLDYVSGDRYNRTPDFSPMNLGEILRSAGFNIRRLPGFEWQETIVAKLAPLLAERIAEADFTKKALELAFVESMKNSKDERHAIWTQRDVYDRAVLMVAQASYRRRLFG